MKAMEFHFSKLCFLAFVIILVLCVNQCTAAAKPRIKPTKIECKSLDENYVHIRHCYLKEKDGLTLGYAHFEMKVHNVNNITYKVLLSQKNPLTGKYMPLLSELAGDFCKSIKEVETNQLFKLIYDAATTNTNINHTCPYDHDIIFENYKIKENFFQTLPIPPGDYLIQVQIAIENDWKVKASLYGTISPKIF